MHVGVSHLGPVKSIKIVQVEINIYKFRTHSIRLRSRKRLAHRNNYTRPLNQTTNKPHYPMYIP